MSGSVVENDSLTQLMENDLQARDYFYSLPALIQNRILHHPLEIRTREELSAAANNIMSSALWEYGSLYDDGGAE